MDENKYSSYYITKFHLYRKNYIKILIYIYFFFVLSIFLYYNSINVKINYYLTTLRCKSILLFLTNTIIILNILKCMDANVYEMYNFKRLVP